MICPILNLLTGNTMRKSSVLYILAIVLLSVLVRADEYRDAIVRDWKRQELDRGHKSLSCDSLADLTARARKFYDWAENEEWCPNELLTELNRQMGLAKTDKSTSPELVSQKYLDLRTAMRNVALANPEVTGQPIVFLKKERFVCQMLHEHMSYYYQVCGMNGGGVFLLSRPGKSFQTESLTEGRFPKGVFQTLSLSCDAKEIYFAFADFSKVQPDDMPRGDAKTLATQPFYSNFETEYMQQDEGKFHLYKMKLADRTVTRLTKGHDDDFDPVEMPDGSLVFVSTRRGGFGRCHGGWEPLRVHTLHRLDTDGKITCLSWHETNEWNPTVTHDGRILYTRWDYVDRDASKHHGLWTTNPNGTAAAVLFGNYTYDVNACYQAKAIPGSQKIMLIGGAHHLDIGGPILILDPLKIHYDPVKSEDDLSCIENVTPEVNLPEIPSHHKSCKHYYHSPWPLSEEVWLTAYSHDPLGGLLASSTRCGKLRLYYRDAFGNLELLYEDDTPFSSMFPIPVAVRKKPSVIPSALPDHAPDFGTFMLSNVNESLVPLPKDRPIKELRIFQLLPKGPGHRGHVPPIGHPFAGNARLLLGTVPVEKDGSAYFKVPARLPVYFQAVDEQGKAVQSMRSLVYLQPGENRGCIGCHEQALTVQANSDGRSLAATRGPSEITPGPRHTNPFSYPLFVQPILDRNCVSCHSGKQNGIRPPLTGTPQPPYSQSYIQLKPWLR